MKRFLITLLGISGVVALYFGARFTLEVASYSTRTETVPARILRWEVEEVGSRYGIRAFYEYGAAEQGTCLLNGPLHLNEWAAIDELKKQALQSHTVYHNGYGHSKLDRTFPTNLAFRFGLTLLVLIYLSIRWMSISKNRSSGLTTNRFQNPSPD